MKVFLGIDTSCYTTSVALMRPDGTLAADARRLLKVKLGGRGLAQSEMVYQHTRNLPEIFAEAQASFGERIDLAGIGVSTKPRPYEESYMPAFLVGQGYAKVLALSHQVPLYPLSHQENHILAGVWSAGGPCAGRFIAVHVSGGTTEITLVEHAGGGLKITLLGGSKDISAGQMVDRIGVAMGLPFPAGPHLEALALQGRAASAKIPLAVKNMEVSFAGPETHVRKLLAAGVDSAAIAAGVESCIAESLGKIIRNAVKAHELKEILLVGGVVANTYIRGRLNTVLSEDNGVKVYFPGKEYSSDNAVGAACLAFSAGTTNAFFAYDT